MEGDVMELNDVLCAFALKSAAAVKTKTLL